MALIKTKNALLNEIGIMNSQVLFVIGKKEVKATILTANQKANIFEISTLSRELIETIKVMDSIYKKKEKNLV